jgi:hypothetical protein
MSDELSKAQYVEVIDLIKEYHGELKKGHDDLTIEIVKLQKAVLELRVKNGLIATVISAITGFMTAVGYKHLR